MAEPKYIIKVTNTEKGKYIAVGLDSLDDWYKKTISNKSFIRELYETVKEKLG